MATVNTDGCWIFVVEGRQLPILQPPNSSPEASIETKNKEIMTKEEQKGSTEASIVEAGNLPNFLGAMFEQCGMKWRC